MSLLSETATRKSGGSLIAIIGSVIITVALFTMMALMIESAATSIDKKEVRKLAEIVMPDREIDTRFKQKKPEKPEPLEAPPQQLTLDIPSPQMSATQETFEAPKITHNSTPTLGFSGSEGEYLPVVKVQPIYPRRALQRGISGYVVVEFTVTKSGSVTDVKVVEEEPSGIFSRSAMNAASKFKYKPRIVDGKAVDVIGVRNKIVFNIEE
ncbi:MAG: energy transducer TonB [Pseudomonadales bacterium]|nr:energy transducer TonB [Pseudomonadales bacterium]